MNERENEYRGCRLHRYLVAEATPTERQAAARGDPAREHRGRDADRAAVLLRG